MLNGNGSPAWAWFDGRLVPFAEARVPIEDRGLQFGESIYELVGVVAGNPFALEAHVDRMRQGAAEIGLGDAVPPPETWRQIVRQLHGKQPHRTAVLYAQLTGGSAPRRYLPAEPASPLFFAYLRPHVYPNPADVARGLTVVTTPDLRWQRCDLKTPMLLASIMAKREAAHRGADEAVFVAQDGYVADGASSSLFAVRQRCVMTTPATHRTLHGTSSELVRGLCHDLGVAFADHHLTLSDLVGADELFLASTALLLMPVVRVNSTPVGAGTPGPISLQLAYHFQRMFWGPVGP